MPSRSPRSRSRSRSPSKRHKKSHKRSRKSSDERTPPSPSNNVSIKKEEGSANDNSSVYKPKLPSVMLPPSFLAKLDVNDEKSRSPPGGESPGKI